MIFREFSGEYFVDFGAKNEKEAVGIRPLNQSYREWLPSVAALTHDEYDYQSVSVCGGLKAVALLGRMRPT